MVDEKREGDSVNPTLEHKQKIDEQLSTGQFVTTAVPGQLFHRAGVDRGFQGATASCLVLPEGQPDPWRSIKVDGQEMNYEDYVQFSRLHIDTVTVSIPGAVRDQMNAYKNMHRKDDAEVAFDMAQAGMIGPLNKEAAREILTRGLPMAVAEAGKNPRFTAVTAQTIDEVLRIPYEEASRRSVAGLTDSNVSELPGATPMIRLAEIIEMEK